MQTHRIVIALNLIQKPPIAVQTRRSSQTAGWGLDIKKNFWPPPWVKFVLDIPFHRTLSPIRGEGVFIFLVLPSTRRGRGCP